MDYCHECHKQFATKYTLKRHTIGAHSKKVQQSRISDNDVWKLLIKTTVEYIHAVGKTKSGDTFRSIEEILEGKDLSTYIAWLQRKYSESRRIMKAAEGDELLQLINGHYHTINEDRARDMNRKRDIVKKICTNFEELNTLLAP